MSTRPHFSLLFVLFCAFLAAACGGSEGPPPKVARASARVAALRILVVAPADEVGQSLDAAVESRLTNAGYTLVADKDQPHDVQLEISVAVRQETGFIKVYKNGKLQTDQVATATLELDADGVALETATEEYDAGKPIPADKLRRLVASLTNSPALATYARKLKARRAKATEEAERKVQEAEDAKLEAEKAARRAQDAKEQAAWNQIVETDCSKPTKLDGCNPVEEFLAKFPTGHHAAEAKHLLEIGHPKIEALLDEQDWNSANAEGCRKLKTSHDCEALERYVQDYPAGAHIDEARAVLDKSRGKIKALAKQEEREEQAKEKREQQEEEQEKKKAAHDACSGQCKDACVDWRHPGKFRWPCYNRCMSQECR